IYSTLNEILRRGGIYKNGAVVLHLDLNHPDALEFIQAPRHELPWVKRCINITDEWWEACAFKEELLFGIKSGDIWLNKVKYDEEGNRIRGNVCLEVYLPSRGTCLLQHVNLGACTINDIPKAFADGMFELCELHGRTGVGESGEYLPPEVDRQVGLGMLGLANLLRRHGISYAAFGEGRTVDRDSGTFGVQTYEYGDVEIASEVGWYAYKRVADGIMTMLNKTGLLHGYSFNSWSDMVTYDEDFIAEWLRSPQTSLYYSLQVMGDVQDKSDAYAALSESEVDDYLSHLLETDPVQCDCQE
ncbi:MAG: ribonucleotide reductase, partial [Euryarchaeota archaeon]|nr:ribonucleotide reductase [Euryarchaeota archaeon]